MTIELPKSAVSAALTTLHGIYPSFLDQPPEDALPSLKQAGHFLRTGEGDPPDVGLEIHYFVGRLGVIAFGSIAPSVAAEHRQHLRLLLEALHQAGFSQIQDKLRVLRGQAGDVFPKDAFFRIRESRYWAIKTLVDVVLVEYNEDSEFSLPDGFTVESTRARDNWGSPKQVQRFLQAISPDSCLPLNMAGVKKLSDATGLSLVEATLLAAGLPPMKSPAHNFLPPKLRQMLALGVDEAHTARMSLKSLTPEDRFNLFANLIPENPANLASPELTRDDMFVRLAYAWNSRFGRRIQISETHVVELEKKLQLNGLARDILAAAIAPTDGPFSRPTCRIERAHHGELELRRPKVGFSGDIMAASTKVISYLFVHAKVGDPHRTALPALYQRLLELLSDHELFFKLDTEAFRDEDLKWSFVREMGSPKSVEELEYADSGLVVAIPCFATVHLYYRPASRIKGESHPRYVKQANAKPGPFNHVPSLEALLSDDFAAMIERVRHSPLEDGQYEANPLWSAPQVVDAIQSKYDLDPHAAVLYAQTYVKKLIAFSVAT